MKRKSGRKSAGKPDEEENGMEDEGSDVDAPVNKKGRKSKAKKSSEKRAQEVESENGDPDEELEESTSNGERQNKRKSKGNKSKKKHEKSDSKAAVETDPLADEDEEEGDEDYEVEAVLDDKVVKGVKHFLIRWKGYTEESDTWEPENTLDCQDLLKEYKEKTKKKSAHKKRGRPKLNNETEEKWDENEDFEVSRILDVYFHKNGKRDFLVSWKGYPSSQSSWEPEDNMDCKDMIAKFMEKVEVARRNEGFETKLRVNRRPVNRLEFKMHEHGRRLSKRNSGKDRVHYFDGE